MMKMIYNEKRVICAFFSLFFLFSSCSSSTRQWQLMRNEGAYEEFSSSRLSLPPENSFSGLEFDIFQTAYGQASYINAFGIELQAENVTPEGLSTVTIIVKTDSLEQKFTGFLLRGGHRVLLPQEASTFIINSLHNQSIEIQIGNYSTTLIHDDFAKHYRNFHPML